LQEGFLFLIHVHGIFSGIDMSEGIG
jgi:hypothetical protein